LIIVEQPLVYEWPVPLGNRNREVSLTSGVYSFEKSSGPRRYYASEEGRSSVFFPEKKGEPRRGGIGLDTRTGRFFVWQEIITVATELDLGSFVSRTKAGEIVYVDFGWVPAALEEQLRTEN
jgi:hypothetical protein